jgi:hypothetical protein
MKWLLPFLFLLQGCAALWEALGYSSEAADQAEEGAVEVMVGVASRNPYLVIAGLTSLVGALGYGGHRYRKKRKAAREEAECKAKCESLEADNRKPVVKKT